MKRKRNQHHRGAPAPRPQGDGTEFWDKFERADSSHPIDREYLAGELGCDPDDAMIDEYMAGAKIKGERTYINAIYQVSVVDPTPEELEASPGAMTYVTIKRRDKLPVHNWRDFLRIKNELCGPERDAVEVYPAMGRLVDEANQYHLWVLPEGKPLGFGFKHQSVVDGDGTTAPGRSRQQPLPWWYPKPQTVKEVHEKAQKKRG